MDGEDDGDGGFQLKPAVEVTPGLVLYYESEEDDGSWIEELLEDDELSSDEAAFMQGYILAEREGFE